MSKYKNYTHDQIEELLSNYLMDSWSYSKVSSFARNEKAFERSYLYNEKDKLSASTIAGQAYHKALEIFFYNLKDGEYTDIVALEMIAFNHIDAVDADRWKIQKTTPTIADCIQQATQDTSKLLKNFMSESKVYLSEIKEVVSSELKIDTWVTVNGADIPLPLHLIIDLVIITNDDKRVIIDHKSKTRFTDESELAFTTGKQAITYIQGYESATGETIDEVWFIENKIAKNRDNSPQLSPFKIVANKETRRLYESILYEPLRRMIQAVSDPDYVYLINDNDNFTDRAELYSFWAKTMIAEIDDFNIPEKKKPLIQNRLRKIRDASLATASPTAIRNFKKYTEQFIPYDLTNKDMTDQEKIEHALRSFGIITKVQHVFEGFSSASYLVEISAGTSIAAVNKYRLDIANALNAPNVRIQKDLFVYEGKSYLCIESGKKSSATLAWDKKYLEGNKIPIGVDNFQRVVIWDMDNHSTPHMLICGATGSGKSVSIKSTIEYALLSGVSDVYIFDPKHEFKIYKSHKGVSVFNEIEDIEEQMRVLTRDMEERVKSGSEKRTLIVFDEFADAVANSKKGKELDIIEEVQDGYYAPKKLKGFLGEAMSEPVPKMKMKVVGRHNTLEENLRILLQKGRSSGFRIIAATQRASTKVITGDAKVNYGAIICLRVPKSIDSQVVIDEDGAESLNGRGDFLFKSAEYLGVVRGQGFYLSK